MSETAEAQSINYCSSHLDKHQLVFWQHSEYVILASVNEEVVFSGTSIRSTYIFGDFWCGFEPNIWLIKQIVSGPDFCGAPLSLDAISTCLFCLRVNPGLQTIYTFAYMPPPKESTIKPAQLKYIFSCKNRTWTHIYI